MVSDLLTCDPHHLHRSCLPHSADPSFKPLFRSSISHPPRDFRSYQQPLKMSKSGQGSTGNYTSNGTGTNSQVHAQPYHHSNSLTCSQGNHWCSRDYSTPSYTPANTNSYHYSNQDGSYYYSNPNGSTYHNDGKGGSTYNPTGAKK